MLTADWLKKGFAPIYSILDPSKQGSVSPYKAQITSCVSYFFSRLNHADLGQQHHLCLTKHGKHSPDPAKRTTIVWKKGGKIVLLPNVHRTLVTGRSMCKPLPGKLISKFATDFPPWDFSRWVSGFKFRPPERCEAVRFGEWKKVRQKSPPSCVPNSTCGRCSWSDKNLGVRKGFPPSKEIQWFPVVFCGSSFQRDPQVWSKIWPYHFRWFKQLNNSQKNYSYKTSSFP